MHLHAEPLSTPKAGNADSEYEDAFSPEDPVDAEGESQSRFAVADGATETSFSGIWARQLVKAYVAGAFEHLPDRSWLTELQDQWWSNVRNKEMPWYAEQKIESGTFAALVGLTLISESPGSRQGLWHAEAIGDSCLFQVRGTEVLKKFPIESSQAFTNSPVLLPSKPDKNLAFGCLVADEGHWQCGDSFYLMSDALAAWFLSALERNEAPWETLRDLDRNFDHPTARKSGLKCFRKWIETARAEGALRNDDVTLYRIEIA